MQHPLFFPSSAHHESAFLLIPQTARHTLTFSRRTRFPKEKKAACAAFWESRFSADSADSVKKMPTVSLNRFHYNMRQYFTSDTMRSHTHISPSVVRWTNPGTVQTVSSAVRRMYFLPSVSR